MSVTASSRIGTGAVVWALMMGLMVFKDRLKVARMLTVMAAVVEIAGADHVGAAGLQRRQVGLVNGHRAAEGVGDEDALAVSPVGGADLEGNPDGRSGGNHAHVHGHADRFGRHVHEILAAGAALDDGRNATAAGQVLLEFEEDAAG